MAKEPLIHKTERKIHIPDVGEPYWQTVCGLRFADKIESITTSDDPKSVTCPRCKRR
jgi:hypothetical protein